MRLAVLISGGKDSILALHRAKKAGHTISALIHVTSTNHVESRMYHLPNAEWVELQAKALNIPLIRIRTNAKAEEELIPLQETLQELKEKQQIQGFVSGAVESVYQATRLEKIGHVLSLEVFSPLWQIDPQKEWEELLQHSFDIRIVAVMANGLDSSWLGVKLTKNKIKQLTYLAQKFQFHVLGEGGEFETFVLDAPLFKQKIKINKSSINHQGTAALLEIQQAKLVSKK